MLPDFTFLRRLAKTPKFSFTKPLQRPIRSAIALQLKPWAASLRICANSSALAGTPLPFIGWRSLGITALQYSQAMRPARIGSSQI
jgi:hypothetical protein